MSTAPLPQYQHLRSPVDPGAIVAFLMIFLSFFRIDLSVGSLIACDFIALCVLATRLPSFLRLSRAIHVWAIFIGLTITGAFSIAVNQINEFNFLARLFLTVIDGIALALLVRPDRSNFFVVLQGTFFAYAVGLVLYLAVPAYAAVVDLTSIKAWIAVGPILAVLIARLRGWYKTEIAAVAFVLLMALFFQSRTLLITGLLFVCYAYLKASLGWKLAGSLVLIAIAFVLFQEMGQLIEAQDHSNTFRSAMILQIAQFSPSELLLGRGIDNWRLAAYRELINMPGASTFFDTANPHFFPAEIIIRGGLMWMSILIIFCIILARKSYTWLLGGIMIAGSFFTTNTGSERVMISIGLFIAIVGIPQFPLWHFPMRRRKHGPAIGRAPSGAAPHLPQHFKQ